MKIFSLPPTSLPYPRKKPWSKATGPVVPSTGPSWAWHGEGLGKKRPGSVYWVVTASESALLEADVGAPLSGQSSDSRAVANGLTACSSTWRSVDCQVKGGTQAVEMNRSC